MANQLLIEQCIQQRRLLRFNYACYARIVEPYRLKDGRDGVLMLCAFQVSGGAEDGVCHGWKLFRIDGLQGAAALDETFQQRMPPRPAAAAAAANSARA